MSFIHLNVASGYSLKYGTTHPHDLVQRAAEFEMPALALTDRDGLAGAIRFRVVRGINADTAEESKLRKRCLLCPFSGEHGWVGGDAIRGGEVANQ